MERCGLWWLQPRLIALLPGGGDLPARPLAARRGCVRVQLSQAHMLCRARRRAERADVVTHVPLP